METEDTAYDVFFSYRRSELALAEPLLDSLKSQGLSVFRDETNVQPLGRISEELKRGLARSRVVVAFFSRDYARSLACQWELTAAYLASQAEGDPTARVIAVNPEPDWNHVHPVALRDTAGLQFDSSVAADAHRIAGSIAGRVAQLDRPIGAVARSARTKWYGLKPTGSPRFVGRLSEMWQLHSRLNGADYPLVSGESARPVLLQGLGGIGKTLLAEEYALRFEDAYPGGVFWISAGGPSSDLDSPDALEERRESAFKSITGELGLGVDEDDIRVHEALLRDAMVRSEGRSLWIVDDLPGGIGASAFRKWLPPETSARVLVTTRTQEFNDLGSPQAVEVLSEADGLEVLLNGLDTTLANREKDAAAAVVAALGGHPLALTVASGYLATSFDDAPIADFLDALADPTSDELELAAEVGDALPTGCDKSISVTLMRSIQKLGKDGRDFLRLASTLSVDPIPTFLVFTSIGYAGELTVREAKRRARLALDQTRRQCLSEHDQGTRMDRVHRLVSRTIAFSDQDQERRAELRAGAAHSLAQDFAELNASGDHAPREPFARHARHLASGRGSSLPETRLRRWLGAYELRQGRYRAAQAILERAIDGHSNHLGPRDQQTLAVRSMLGDALSEQGFDKEAKLIFEDVIRILEESLGKGHLDTLPTASCLANSLGALGDLAGAEQLARRVWKDSCAAFGPESREAVVTGQNLAGHLQHLGRDKDAVVLFNAAIQKIRSKRWSGWQMDLIRSRNNLAVSLRTLGEIRRARDVQLEGIDALAGLVEKDHPNMLTARMNLALTYDAAGDSLKAEQIYRELLEPSRRAWGHPHPQRLALLGNLGHCLQNQGRSQDALALSKAIVRDSVDALGEEHPSTLTAKNNLAHAHQECGEFDEAARLHKDTLECMRKKLGPDDPRTLIAISSWAGVLLSDGDIRDVVSLQREVVAARERTLGDNHSDTWNGWSNLGYILSEQGHFQEALEYAERAIEKRCSVLGPEHPDTLASMNIQAECLIRLEQEEEGLHLRKKILQSAQGVLGFAHPTTLAFLAAVAMSHDSKNDTAMAHSLFAHAFDLSHLAYGKSNPGTLRLGVAHADSLRRSGNTAAALAALQLILPIAQKQGPKTIASFAAAWAILECHLSNNDHESARVVRNDHLSWLLERSPESIPWHRNEKRLVLLKELGKG